jgi:hypothetical protein
MLVIEENKRHVASGDPSKNRCSRIRVGIAGTGFGLISG